MKNEQSKWIPVEKAPPMNIDVLVYADEEMAVASFNPDCPCTTKWHGGGGITPTYWQPLPSPPEAARVKEPCDEII